MTVQMVCDHDYIYQTLSEEILRFDHKPGDPLSEHYLCERFSVSRTPVRSVLQRLQENGLVQILPRKGSIVTRLNYDVINQLIYQRVAVESMVLRDFIRICTPADVERVRFAFSRLCEVGRIYLANPREFEADVFLKTDLSMHEIWFRATNNRFLWELMSRPQSSYTRFCTLDIIEGSNVCDVLKDHEEMLRLIDARSTDGIEELMRRHLYGGIRRLGGLVFTKYAGYFEPMTDQSV
ncbi:MAG: GntR family transcriptional regulator [Clostridia bacterium]|nr:GntR family transcriptional regulator [Clostridia bacterium]